MVRALSVALFFACGTTGCSELFGIQPKKEGAPCEADTENDPDHCGGCGHSCLGGTCSAGRCEPLLLASPAVEAGTGPGYVTLDDTHVYWSETASRQLRRVHKQGTHAETLVTTEPGTFPTEVGVDGDVYFAVYNESVPTGWIGKYSLAEDEVTKLVEGLSDWPWSLAVRDGRIAWGNRGGDNVVLQTDTDGAAPEVLVDGYTPCCEVVGLAFDSSFLYFTRAAGGVVGRVNRQSRALEVLTDVTFPVGPSTDAEAVYWGANGGLWRFDKQTSALTMLANIGGFHSAPDEHHVYFTVAGELGLLGRVRKDGTGAVEVLVSGLNGAYGVAVDGEAVYFATQFESIDGRYARGVYKLAK